MKHTYNGTQIDYEKDNPPIQNWSDERPKAYEVTQVQGSC